MMVYNIQPMGEQPQHAELLLAKLREYYAAYGVLPTQANMTPLCGWNAHSWTSTIVARLERDGFLARTPEQQLMPGRRFHEPPSQVRDSDGK